MRALVAIAVFLVTACGANPAPAPSAPSAAAAVVVPSEHTGEWLISRCAQRTIVMGRTQSGEVDQTGETIDGYCAGYLRATFEGMIASSQICLENSDPPDDHFLASVLQTYAEQTPPGQVASDAFARAAIANAFACTRDSSN
jgi:hypothetical protein